jgi:hypothetical protein
MKSENPLILCDIHHQQNPIESNHYMGLQVMPQSKVIMATA